MAKDRQAVTTNGRAAFYAAMWPDLRAAALSKGWALGIHGSLASDMDIMAMPWTDDAVPVEELIDALWNCFEGMNMPQDMQKPYKGKPFGRLVYTIPVWADFYIDLSIMSSPFNP